MLLQSSFGVIEQQAGGLIAPELCADPAMAALLLS